MITPNCITTENGIRAIIHEDTALPYESFSVCVDTSGEIDDINSSHFIEHVIPEDKTQLNGLSLFQHIEQSGNVANAATYTEVIRFHLNSVPESVHETFPLLLQTLAEPNLDPATIASQREIIDAEMRERIANPFRALGERVLLNHGFSFTSLYEAEGLTDVTRESLQEYHARVFGAQNLLVIAAGPVSTDDIKAYIENSPFAAASPTENGFKTREFLSPITPVVAGNETNKTVHYLEFFDATSRGAASEILGELLHSEESDSLLSRARSDGGVYNTTLTPSADPYAANSRYYLQSEGTLQQMKFIHDLGDQILSDIAENPPSEAILDRTRRSLRNRTIFVSGSRSPYGINTHYFSQLPSYPSVQTPEQMLEEYSSVTPGDIQSLAQTLRTAPKSHSVVGSTAATNRLTSFLSDL